MYQLKGSQPSHQNTLPAVVVSAAAAGAHDCGQAHWIPSGVPRTGDEYLDFSCHEIVRITPHTPSLIWRDDTFFFCSSFCQQRFAQAPDEFLMARFVVN